MSHSAMVGSSSRMATNQQKVRESQLGSASSSVEQTADQLSNLSIVSFSSNDMGELAQEMAIRRTKAKVSSTPIKSTSPVKPMVAPLDELKTVSDIDSCMDPDLYQLTVLNTLEDKWGKILTNFQAVLDHLQECSSEVAEASTKCLEAALNSIETTCDSVDSELKAMYHLMTKCDELVTKLSAATSFRDEIKTLRKSVDTLEQLYKMRPMKIPPQRS